MGARPGRRKPLHLLVLAAGQGKRLSVGPDAPPKVLVECLGLALLEHVRRAAAPLKAQSESIVVGHRAETLRAWLKASWKGARAILQQPQAGTGHAVRVALEALPRLSGDLLVLSGDVPQVTTDDLDALVKAHRAAGALASLITGCVSDAGRLGRVRRSPDGRFQAIVEARDADAATLALTEFNTGIYVFDISALRGAVAGLGRSNAQGEEYLTDAVARLAARAPVLTVAAADPLALLGVNDAADLAHNAGVLRRRIAAEHLRRGARIVDPETTVIEPDVTIAPGARILPFTYIARGCVIGPDCVVGPFAHLRGGTVLEAGAQLGNFVEAKAALLKPGAKAKHLTYLGDAEVGARANVGCGTVTANYDGQRKHRTVIGADARIGSGTILVAPVTVGQGAVTGANSVILTDVPSGVTAVGVPARHLERRPARAPSKAATAKAKQAKARPRGERKAKGGRS